MQLTSKVSIALLGAFAAVGEANNHGFHARQMNFHPGGYNNQTVSTSVVPVYPTPEHSSAPVAPSAPASSPAGVAASSPIIGGHYASSSSSAVVGASSVAPVPVPLGTGVSSSAPVSAPAAAATGSNGVSTEYDTVTSTKDVTLTYTLGSGSTQSVVTTTIHRTVTDVETIYVVC